MTTILNTLEAPPRYIPNDPRPTLIGLTRSGLAEALGLAGVPEKQRRMRAGQIWHWIYHRGVQDFAEMTNISRELRERLDET
ncbi:MAG: 23S rRNA (adenine(2503)-C(2))-methyltransferase RlmN, partial [Aestuariivirga sp.]